MKNAQEIAWNGNTASTFLAGSPLTTNQGYRELWGLYFLALRTLHRRVLCRIIDVIFIPSSEIIIESRHEYLNVLEEELFVRLEMCKVIGIVEP